MAGSLASKTIAAGSRLDVLTAFDELWDYVLVVVSGKNMPNYLRYSIGEEIINELKQVGWYVQSANLSHNQGYRKAMMVKADQLFQQVKFDCNLMLHCKALFMRRAHLYELEVKFGRLLGGWLNSCIQQRYEM